MANKGKKQSFEDLLMSLLKQSVRTFIETLHKKDALWDFQVNVSTKTKETTVTILLTHGDVKMVLFSEVTEGNLTHALATAILNFSSVGVFYAYNTKLADLKRKHEDEKVSIPADAK